jgi:glutamate-ammonia-ligase adenylyltransferase
LAEFLIRSPRSFVYAVAPDSLPTAEEYRAALGSRNITTSDELRHAYRELLVTIAAWDLLQPSAVDAVKRVGEALADLADATVDAALTLSRAALTAPIEHSDSVRLTVIAMGKTGARELNYLSDVDVIFVFESESIEEHVGIEIATKIARGTIAVLNEPGVEPPLWELDANLRPEGAKGALVRSLDSHVAYYERWAENWEFQALLKARPMAGDSSLGARYLDAMSDFVWSSSTREGFVESVQRMRERVSDNIPSEDRDVQIKLGPGGLRDIEFTVQLLQLVHGKDDASVRSPNTLIAIEQLAHAGFVGRAEASTFSQHYRELRVLEHRVQLLALRRTHLMPRDEDAVRIVARSSGFAETAEGLLTRWEDIKRDVRSLHERLFYRPLLSAVATLPGEDLALSRDQAEARLRSRGFRDPAGALRHIEALTAGVSRSGTIQRNLMPVLLHWMSEGTDPDSGLASFRRVSESLGDSPWYLRMLRDSVGAAQRLSLVLSMSAYVSVLVEGVPDAVAWLDDDELLQPRTRQALDDEFGATGKRHTDVDDAAKAIRFARRRELLRIALSSVLNLISIEELGSALSDVSAAALQAFLDLARRDSHGIEFAVVAMGRFGGEELGFSSDLDVLWVFRDTGAGDDAHRIAERIVHDIVRLSEDVRFPLELDAGLRPEGKNGPLVRSLDAYAAYYEKWSDIWETQALTRARPIAGDSALRADFESMADSVRYSHEISEDGIREIRRIKARVETERLPFGADRSRHTKLGPGTLSDVEWLVQLWQLRFGSEYPALRNPSTLEALDVCVEAGLFSPADGAALREAWLMSSHIRSAITLYSSKDSDVVPVERRDLEGVARILGYLPGHGSELENDFLRVSRQARQVFERLFYPA